MAGAIRASEMSCSLRVPAQIIFLAHRQSGLLFISLRWDTGHTGSDQDEGAICTEWVVKNYATDHLLLVFCTDPPGALRGPLHGLSGYKKPDFVTRWGPFGPQRVASFTQFSPPLSSSTQWPPEGPRRVSATRRVDCWAISSDSQWPRNERGGLYHEYGRPLPYMVPLLAYRARQLRSDAGEGTSMRNAR